MCLLATHSLYLFPTVFKYSEPPPVTTAADIRYSNKWRYKTTLKLSLEQKKESEVVNNNKNIIINVEEIDVFSFYSIPAAAGCVVCVSVVDTL